MSIKFSEVEKYVSDGDIISVLKVPSSKLIDKMIAYWEKSPIYHSGIAIWIDGKLNVLQMDPDGDNIIPISHFQNNIIHVIKKPDTVKLNMKDLTSKVHNISYSYYSAVVSGIAQYIPCIPALKSRKKCCSQYCADVWDCGGLEPKINDILDPYELEHTLIQRGCHVIEVNG